MSVLEARPDEPQAPKVKARVIKVLVWDLDNTVWNGTLLEGDDVQLRPGILELLQLLDRRGILHSIASRNEPEPVLARLQQLGVAEFFLYPQIHWGSKAASVEQIARSINIGLDAVAFVDDQPFELAEVAQALPAVLTLDVSELAGLAERPEFIPRFLTGESALRRQMYRSDLERNQAEEQFAGPSEEFLASLQMRFTIAAAQREDLQRAEELTVRTNQLNTTGYTYSYEELDAFRSSPQHRLLVASLEDRFGSYGKIGLALVDRGATGSGVWHLKLLLMSCRVMSRGVGTLLLNHILSQAREAGVRLQAEFRANGRNRMMLITFKFGGFEEIERRGDLILFEHPSQHLQPPPPYVEISILD